MHIYSRQNSIRNITLMIFVLGLRSFLFAQGQSLDATTKAGPSSGLSWQEEKKLSTLQKEARDYRAQGLELQRMGNTDAALSLYQKAIELDPGYAVAYNDLGVIYEAEGLIDSAEECYLKAAQVDPNYASAYTNLALFYENKRDLGQAAFYWEKRKQFGSPDDPWTRKARQRIEDIRAVLSKDPLKDAREQETLGLMKDVSYQKSILREDPKALAKYYFQNAKRIYYEKGDKLIAYKIATNAGQLDPANTEIEEFVDKVQTELLSR